MNRLGRDLPPQPGGGAVRHRAGGDEAGCDAGDRRRPQRDPGAAQRRDRGGARDKPEGDVELPGSSTAHLPLHEAVVEAIREHDADDAENAMNELIERVQSDIERFFQRPEPKAEQQGSGQNKLRLIE